MAEVGKLWAMKRVYGWAGKLRQSWQQLDRISQQILVVLVGVALVFSLPAAALSGDWKGLALNLGTELAGAAVTFVLLDQIVVLELHV